eukprot:CAMPEP_0177679326 /NCGR_PEP_ID=MMETSP0447-20121125/29536_1 /TAXON_ID=0 /ORGANISM="Stygamoeba regulata, Strain BSH-02190019" /LENGTH=260 /DNA_ID=CAMNT_0019188495 /DNA_START=108 /DNA_END=890 /DNA_ORIENTATION=+
MSAEKVWIYVLRLKSDKYYVGKTTMLDQRLRDHFNGDGPQWTQMYPPINVDFATLSEDPSEENYHTERYMKIHGVENVRGGMYFKVKHDEILVKALEFRLKHDSDLCVECSSSTHFVSQCPKKLQASGYRPQYAVPVGRELPRARAPEPRAPSVTRSQPIPQPQQQQRQPQRAPRPSAGCARCGRSSHSADRCFASTTEDGYPLFSSSDEEQEFVYYRGGGGGKRRRSVGPLCQRCGREGHHHSSCYAKWDIDGDYIGDA